jgi:hypothetical protein
MNDTAGIDDYDATPLLSVYLGHKHLTGTQVYLHMTAENSKDIFGITMKMPAKYFRRCRNEEESVHSSIRRVF